MHIQARRIFRLSFTSALSLAIAYMVYVPLPYMAPLFAFFLTASPSPPLGIKKLIGLLIVILITLGIGLLLIPMLLNFQITALLLVLVGLYFSTYLTINLNKGLVGLFLAMGITLISAAGTVNFSLASFIIEALISNIIIVVLCQLVIYPFYPEDPPPSNKITVKEDKSTVVSNWIAIRSTIIVFPVYLVLLSNPMAYTAIAIKSILLSQQSTHLNAKNSANELIGSTLLGGVFSILFWMCLGLWVNLWMFSLWMLAFSLYFSCKMYHLISSKFPASFWLNTFATMLIMLGPAVEDSANGKDVYAAFFNRAILLILVSIYALLAIYFLEYLKTYFSNRTKILT
jgi:hypothetical protein